MNRVLLVASVLAAAISPARTVHACSAPAPCAVVATLPGDGALEVPLNVELEAFVGRASPRAPIDLVLREADTGIEVPLVEASTRGRMRPEELLSPSTRYELLAPRQVSSNGSPTGCDVELAVLATFTTGTELDTTAPTEVTASGGGCSVSVCGSSACCGPFVAATSGASWSAHDDGALPVAYAFGSPDGPRTFATGGSSALVVRGSPIGGGVFGGRGDAVPGASPVYAIDAAGNVSEADVSFALDFSCAPSDGEAEELLRCSDPRAECSGSGSGGCAVSHAPASRAVLAIVALVVLALVVRRRSPIAIVLAVGTTVIMPAPIAHACSASPECMPASGTLPADGALDVPLNVELEAFVTWPRLESAPALRLRVADGGEEVPLVAASTSGRMRSEAPLAPSTRYELLATREIATRPSPPRPCDDTLVVVATFTTGTAVDDTPPTSLTAAAAGCSFASCSESSCCGPYSTSISFASWSADDDGSLAIAYAFGSADGPRTYATSGAAASTIAALVGRGTLPLPGSGPIYAIDAAGNVSSESVPLALDACAPPPAPDAGTTAEPTASAGCALTHASSSRSALALVLLALAARLAHRRR